MQAGKEYLKHMGQYPVIFLSLNSSKQPLYEMAYLSIAYEIRKEYSRHSYLLRDDRMEESIKKIYNDDIEELVIAFEDGNCNKISDIITGQLMETISFYDYREDYYHGFLAGLLKYNKKYFVKSNRKSGLGRYDLVMKTRRIRQGKAIIIELKVAESINNLESGGSGHSALAEAGIKVYGGVTGETGKAVEDFLAGKLDYNPDIQCSHHEGRHHGGKCGEDKHGCHGSGSCH